MKKTVKILLGLTGTVALAGGLVGVAQATTPAPAALKVCVSKSSATVRMYANGTGACHSWERTVTWNAAGQAGARGATGSTGKSGPAGAPGANGKDGLNGLNGQDGKDGKDGQDGKDASYAGGHWGVVHRNVIGNGDADLAGATVAPPLGQGALNLRTGSPSDKAAFGNETDFRGVPLSTLSAIGYSVFTTGENNAVAPNNMPSITFEIDPNVTGSSNYASLVYVPENSAANAWSSIDAKADAGKHWGLTGAFFNAQPDRCGLNGPRCTFAEVMAYLSAHNDTAQGEATLLTAQITKGRDFAFSGAVDALVIGDTTYDFEPLGVYAVR